MTTSELDGHRAVLDGTSKLSSAASAVQATQIELSRLLRHARTGSMPSVAARHEADDVEVELGSMAARTLKDYKELQDEYSILEDQHFSQVESADEKLNAAQHEIYLLTQEVDRQKRENRDVSRVLERTKKDLRLEKERSRKLREATNKLRQLLSHSVRESEGEKRKRAEVDAFFKRLGDFSPSVLDASTPPSDFEFLEVEPVHALEVERLRVAVGKYKAENAQLKCKVEGLLKEKVEVKAASKKRINKAEALASSKQTQLIGALRRIKYLVSEQAAMRKSKAECEQYILQLENKLLELNSKLSTRVERQTEKKRLQREESRKKAAAMKSRFVESAGCSGLFSEDGSGRSMSGIPSPIRSGHASSSSCLGDSAADEKFAEWQQQHHSIRHCEESKVWEEDMVLPELEDEVNSAPLKRSPQSSPR